MSEPFKTRLTIRVSDLNYGGHLGNDRVLLFFHEARIRFLRRLGLTEGDIGDGVSLTQTESYIKYKGEGFLGDIVEIEVKVLEWSRIRFKVFFVIQTIPQEITIAEGYTVLAGFDYQSRKPAKLPDSFIKLLENT